MVDSRFWKVLLPAFCLSGSIPLRAASVGEEVAATLRARGTARVVVTLKQTVAGSPSAARAALAARRDAVLAMLGPGDFRLTARWSSLPGFAGDLTADGLRSLSNHPDVAAVDLDVPGSGSDATSAALVGADQVQALGWTGAGVVVAILDSGVAGAHPDLADSIVAEQCFCTKSGGAGCCPNTLTEQSGPGSAADDNGHGTNVAGIITSNGTIAPKGIAPGASIVAVKVLDSNNAFSGTAQVLSGLDWIISNRPDVRVVNMSLGTFALYAGFCDGASSFTRLFGTAIDTLRDRGTIVFVSSGNDGSLTQMECPACIANAVAVSAVYSSNVGPFSSFGCTDSTTAADKVACFSNVSSALDLLAPGAPITSTGFRGGTSTYAGTSQGSPHAAAGAALLFQKNPTLTPAAIESALKTTGKAVTDERTGLVFPRIQLLDAVQSIAPLAAIAPLPGGNAFDAGALVSFVANVTQVDPNDPTTVSWDFGDGTSGTGTPVTHAYGAPGSYVVTLKVRDTLGLVSTATLIVTVRTPAFMGGPEQLLPVVLDTGGAGGTHYTTELTLGSKAPVPVTVLLQYTASAGAGSGYARITLAPGELRVIPGAIGFLRSSALAIPNDGSAQIGTLRVLFQGASSSSDVFVGGRTSTPGAGGTFGLFYTGAATSTTTATIFGLQQNAAQRSNLALVNAGADPVTLRVQLQGPSGEALSSPADQTLASFGWTQLNQPLLGLAASGRAVVTRVTGAGSFTAYGVLNDAVTSDGSFVPPQVPGDATGADRLVPIVLTTAGYQSELTLTNFTSQPMALTLVYTGSPQLSAAGTGSAPFTLQPGEQLIRADAMVFLRNLGLPIPTGSVGGSLLIRAPAGTPASSLATGARTFTNAVGGGTFGLFYSGLTLGESATASATVNGLQQNERQRSNLAIVNRGDASDTIALRVTYYGADGAALSNPDTATLAPGEWKQFNGPLASRGATAGFAKIERLSGSSRWAAYGVLNDQHNSDGSYIPMSR
jgi:subtilisin family serine protease